MTKHFTNKKIKIKSLATCLNDIKHIYPVYNCTYNHENVMNVNKYTLRILSITYYQNVCKHNAHLYSHVLGNDPVNNCTKQESK